MKLEEFVEKFSELFDEVDPKTITADTDFQSLDEWGSLTAMAIIALVKTEYNKAITGKEIRSCKTVADLYHLISANNGD